MTLTLHLHPLASFCHKVLVALYENGTPFEARIVDFSGGPELDRLAALWPVGKIPVLEDGARGRIVAETTIIIDYLDRHHPGARRLVPEDPEAAREARLWDRVFDLYIHAPMQKIVTDRLRPESARDAFGVEEARATLATAYAMADRHLEKRRWACGDDVSMADCAAAPALFYAGIVAPFADAHPHLSAYFERLVERPSVRRVIDEARPFFPHFPYVDAMPARFRNAHFNEGRPADVEP
ncbi:glutathione S-transferase family protein [Ensifer soli]|uniref:glutathione S-transferase family protein n=1 Tax=Ciceribacter sp. sgz301302 TaxID=3342379 RepID=UPI0035B8E9F3